jgi:PAS domain S-box-containing protein
MSRTRQKFIALKQWFLSGKNPDRLVARIVSSILVLVGCLVLIGWIWDLSFFKSVVPGSATMKANTAICFILAGIALGLQTRKRQNAFTTRLALGCAIAVGTIGLLTLCQYLFNWNLGIDELLFRDIPVSPNTAHPGRMGENTALNFSLTGLALYLNGKRTRRSYYVAQTATFIAATIALLAVVGYIYNVHIFYRFILYSSSMAIHTALTFLVLCIGILSSQKDGGWMQIVASNSLGGIVARQLIPAAIGIPLILGWLIRAGRLAGWYDDNFGLSLMVMSLIVISLGSIGRSAAIINKIESDRKRSSDRLRSSEERLQLALRGSSQGIWDWDLKTEVLTWDDRCKEIFGLPPDFPVTYEWHIEALHPDDRERLSEAGTIALRDRTEFNEEYRTFHPDGTMRWILARGRGYYNGKGEPERMSGTVLDISESKQAEVKLEEQEKRYRYIFESVGVSIWEQDFSEVKEALDRLKASGVEDFERYFNEHPEFVQWAIGAIRILNVNATTLQIYGARDKEQILTSLQENCLPETIPAFIGKFLAIAAGETFFQSETVVRTLQGERKDVLFTVTFPPPTEFYDRVLVTWTDITDRKRRELNDRFLNELDLKLRQLSDAKAMQWEVVSSLGEYLNVDRAIWLDIDWENRLITIERDWRSEGLPSHVGTYSLSNFIAPELQFAHAAGETIVFSDVTTDPNSASYVNNYQQLGIGAMVAVPCIQEGRWVAVLTVNVRNPRNWRNDEVNLLQTTVARLWSIIEQTQAAQALRESEERLRLALAATEQGLYDLNVQTGEAKVNPEYALMLGYDPERFRETSVKWLDRLHPDEREFISKFYQEYIAGDRDEYRVEFRQRTQSGDWKWILSIGKIVAWDAEKKPLRMIGTHINISDRKQAEVELKESNNRIQLLYEITRDLLSTKEPLALVDAIFAKLKTLIGLDIYFNYILDEQKQKLHLIFSGGISEETAKAIEWLEIGQAICGTVAQQKCQIIQPNLQQSIDPKTELVRALGLTAYSCQPLLSQGKLFGTLGFGSFTRTEFTPVETTLFQAICDRIAIALERSEILSSLQQQTEELIKANRLKDEFLAALSHELRTPLNPILGWTRLLQSQKLTVVKTKEALATIERNVKQQIALVDNLLDLSRVVQGQFKLTSQSVELVPIINAAIDTVYFAASAKSIALEFHFPAHSAIQIMGDETRLQQVFWNLLSNAIKFTPDGGRIDVWLEVCPGAGGAEEAEGAGGEFLIDSSPASLERKSSSAPPHPQKLRASLRTSACSYVQIRITDTGIGISGEFLPYVFDRFRQADGSTTRRYGGLGLGLALVKHLVELHGGTVEAESSGEGKGATFKVNLPLLKQMSLNFPEKINLKQSPTESLGSCPSGSLTGVRVLIVDDEPDNLDLVEFILTQEGAIVTAVISATEVLAIFSENPPDILISDIGMPEMSGYELLQQIRALPSQQNNPISAIALTAFAQQEDREKAIAAGFQGYISKPINPIELIAAIAERVGS